MNQEKKILGILAHGWVYEFILMIGLTMVL